MKTVHCVENRKSRKGSYLQDKKLETEGNVEVYNNLTGKIMETNDQNTVGNINLEDILERANLKQ